MYKVSELLGKPLLLLGEAKIEGTVANVYFDSKLQRGTFVKIFTCDDEVRYFPLCKMLNASDDAAVILNSECLTAKAEGICPINRHAFDQDGKSLGVIKDVIMDGTKVVSILANDEHSPLKLLNIGNVLIFNTSGKALKLKASAKKYEPKDENAAKKEVQLPVKTAFAPSYDFLIGKKMQRTISATNGKIIAREGESVTSQVISDAKKEGKLVILALNAL